MAEDDPEDYGMSGDAPLASESDANLGSEVRARVVAIVALGAFVTVSGAFALFMMTDHSLRQIEIPAHQDIVARRAGTVLARSGSIGVEPGDRCVIEIAPAREGRDGCRLHILCRDMEQAFIFGQCPNENQDPLDRTYTFENYDGALRPIGAATLMLDPKAR